METKQINHEVFINAAAHDVFEALMDARRHTEMTGEAAQIDRKPGGAFTTYGGHVSGKTIESVPDRKLVQDWRASDWKPGYHSRVSISLEPVNEGGGTQLSLEHAGVPAEHVKEISDGWRSYYWSKLPAYLRKRQVAAVRLFLEEFKNHSNLDIVDTTWTKDCQLHVPGMTLPQGWAAQKQVGAMIFAAFGDVHVEVNQTIVEGDRVVERHTATAVHKGEFLGLKATGKRIHWTENHIYRIEDGLIAEAWSEVSFHDVIAQISSASHAAA
ncbi:MAG TPA: ester cyclase [Vicinamibacterales bacterium]|nr:ester cyclase [Vicinamibacterales bacterium]